MRTTVTLDDDVYRKLESESRRSRRPFRVVLNEHLRRSLASAPRNMRRPPFRVEARDMGLQPGMDPSHVQELLDQLDGVTRR